MFKTLTSQQQIDVVREWLVTNGKPDYARLAKETGGSVVALRVALRRAKIKLAEALEAESLDLTDMVGG